MYETRIAGTFLLPSLACSYSYPKLLQSDSAHRFKGYHWVTGRSSIGIWSVHLGTVYQSPLNMISWPIAHEDPSHIFLMSHAIASWARPLASAKASRKLGLVSRHHVAPPPQAEQGLRHNVSSCREEKRKWKGWGAGGHTQTSNKCLSEEWLFRAAKLAPVHHSQELWARKTRKK